jgi:hypothetical protein
VGEDEVRQQLHALAFHAVADVARHLRGTDDAALFVADGRHAE